MKNWENHGWCVHSSVFISVCCFAELSIGLVDISLGYCLHSIICDSGAYRPVGFYTNQISDQQETSSSCLTSKKLLDCRCGFLIAVYATTVLKPSFRLEVG